MNGRFVLPLRSRFLIYLPNHSWGAMNTPTSCKRRYIAFKALVCAAGGLFPAYATAATTTTIDAKADARVRQSNPTTNYATSDLMTSAATSGAIETYVKFSVAGVSGTVSSVKLRLYTTTTVNNGPGVYATSSSWTETGLTWNNRPAATSALLADVAATTKNKWIEWAVTGVTVDGTYSFVLRHQATSVSIFQAREAANKPQLVIIWDNSPCASLPNGAACTDSNVCTNGDTCQSGACVPGPALNCNDANGCTADSCNVTAGCVNTVQTGSCDLDSNKCTADTCSAGNCTPGGALVCADANACTDDSCNSTTGCVYTNNTAPCTADTNLCTLDMCGGGTCQIGPNSKCTDGNGCTTDTCDATTGACSYTTEAICGSETVLPFAATWKYLVTATAAPSGWATSSFADSAWPSGAAPLGYGVTGLGTTIGYGTKATTKYVTTYFRRKFSISKVSDYNQLLLTIKRDDGAVVYLNGSELYRTNMALGAVAYNTLAVADATGDNTRTFAVPVNLLILGQNQIAVELHQQAGNSSDLSFDLELGRKCGVPIGNAANEAFETKCDGLDNDCDGNTDLLMPYGANVCSTGQLGACGTGVFACLDGAKACLTAPQTAEAKNGVDDNCDGIVDNLASVPAKNLKIRVLMPHAMWSDSPTYAQGLIEMLEAAGVPYYALTKNSVEIATDWYTGFDTLADYPIVIIPGYLQDEMLAVWQMQKLTDYMSAGGIVVMFKPLGAAVGAFAGHTSFTNVTTARNVRIANNVPASLFLESPEEQDFLLSKDPAFSPVSLYTFGIDAAQNVTVWGNARDGAASLGAVFTRKPVGSGALYALGYDPLSFTWMRCYVNCFDPGRDILAVLFKAWLREAGGGHMGSKHTAPTTGPSIAIMSHDIDAPDSHNAGSEYGAAGAIQMAQAEQARGVKGSYMITTDYVTGYNNANLPTDLCNLGMCPVGGHSIQHLIGAGLPLGDCNVTKATYNTSVPTVCGETVVNLDILKAEIPGTPAILSWRCPYLSVHPNQFEVLALRGVRYDSSYAVGDLRSNFPLKADRWPYVDHVFKQQPLWEFPIVQEDGRGDVTNGVTTRVELQQANQKWFLNNWYYAALKNAANGAWNMTLVHPSYGVGVGPENTVWKIDTIAKFLDLLAPHGIHVSDMTSLADWWRARDEVKLGITWNGPYGYVGTITVGSLAIKNFGIEFSDNISSFTSNGGAATVAGRRVVFSGTLAANSSHTFTANVQ
ncbi:MAG: DNRLRE domain-containing protein [Myxococcales bacterium]|nr:DNRLRE domain-containing protein [Myxococcales bacterium]